jgi:hypothetical protein
MMSPTLMPMRSESGCRRSSGFARDHGALDVERAPHRRRGARKLGKEPVARGLHEATALLPNLAMRDFLAQLPQPRKGQRLVALHEAAETGDIGHHDRRQSAFGRRRDHDGVSLDDPESYPIASTIDAKSSTPP